METCDIFAIDKLIGSRIISTENCKFIEVRIQNISFKTTASLLTKDRP